MSKKLLMLVLIFLSASGCSGLPEFPTVEIKLVDEGNGKIHRYNLPKQRGESAPYLGSDALSVSLINKNFCFAPSEYSKVEQYISTLEDVAKERCK